MNCDIANKVIEFIFTITGRYAIVCDLDGVIVAAKIPSRVGNIHTGAQTMLREHQPHCMVTMAQEEASGGAIKAGCNVPITHNDEIIGSIGVTGDPEMTEPVSRMAAGLISKELREQELLDRLIGHAGQMDHSIKDIVLTVEQVNGAQTKIAAMVDQVETLLEASLGDLQTTDEVLLTIQSIASNTQMLGLNAAIEAAHAREHGKGFSIVAEAVRKLSTQCAESADAIKVTQARLQASMGQVVAFSKDLSATTHGQTQTTGAIAGMVTDLKDVSEALMALTRF
jgi:hypothetical protein